MVIAGLLSAVVGLLIYAAFSERSESDFALTPKDGEQKQSRWLKMLSVTSAEILSSLPAGVSDKIQEAKPNPNIERLFQQSGNPWNLSPKDFRVVQIGSSLFGAVILTVMGFLISLVAFDIPLFLYAAAGAGLGFIWPGSKYRTAAENRATDFKRQLPNALDLLIISLSAGVTFPTALRETLPNMTEGVLKDEFTLISRSLDSGKTLEASLEGFAERSPSDSVTAFIRAVQEATALNVPLIDVLESRADASRQEYFAMLQQKTASLESKMMAVLTPTLVPALLVTVMAPSVQQLMTMM